MQNFKTLRQSLLGELAMSPEERKKREREKMPFIVATYVYASSQGQRTHSARTKIYYNTKVGTVDHVLGSNGDNSFIWSICSVFNLSHTSKMFLNL
jgi:hypothetical protein